MAEELRSVLGFDASGAISQVAALTSALNSYNTAITAAAKATSAFNRSASGFTGAVNSVANSLNASQKATVNASRNIDGVGQSAGRAAKPIQDLGEQTKRSGAAMILTWQSVVRIFTIQVIHQALSRITGAISQSSDESRKYVKALSEVQTVSQGMFTDLGALATKVEEFSAATGQPLDAVTEGLYETLSNQVVDAAHSFEFLQDASDFSIAAVADLSSSVNLLSSVMNSYNMSASQAATVSGKLFKAIEVGRFRGQEIADTFGRVAVLSAQLGISLDEVLASMAALTISGMKYNEAFTLVTNVQLKLIKPTEEMKSRFAEMGISMAEAGIQAYGFQGFLGEIAKGSGETASELANLYGRVRAIRGALGLGAQASDFYADSLEKIKAAGAGTISEAKAFVFETNARQVELELNRLNIALINFGKGATAATKFVFDSFGGAVGTIKAMTIALASGAAAWLILRANASGALQLIIWQFSAASGRAAAFTNILKGLGASPAFWAAAVVGGVLLIQYALNRGVKAAKEARDAMDAALAGKSKTALLDYETNLTKQIDFNKKLLGEVQKMLFERQKLYNDARVGIEYAETVLLNNLESQLDKHISGVESMFGGFKNKINSLTNDLKGINTRSSEIRANIADWQFDRSIKGLDSVRESFARIDRAQSLQNKALELSRKGEFELAKMVSDRAVAQSEAALAAADQSGNTSLIYRAEQSVEKSMQGQLTIQEHMKQEAISNVKAIEQQSAAIGLLTTELKTASGIYKELGDSLKKTTDPIDRERIINDMTEIASFIQKKLGDIKIYARLANANELQSEFSTATGAFYNSLTGQVNTFEQAARGTINTLARVRAEVGAFDTTEQQKVAVQLGQQLDEGTAALLRQKEAQLALNAALQSTANSYTVVEQEVKKVFAKNAWSAPIAAEKEWLPIIRELSRGFSSASQAAMDLAKAGQANTNEYANALEKVNAFRPAFEALGADPLAAFQAVYDKLLSISDLQKTISTEGEKGSIAQSIMDQVSASADPIQSLMGIIDTAALNTGQNIGVSISTGMATGTSAVQSGAASQISALQQVEAQAIRTSAAMAGASGGIGKATGGFIYRAVGGQAKGTDTIPAMLSPGEFVVNAGSTRKFFSQLVAINSGRQPIFRKDGGTSSVGDINISINEAHNPKATARELGTLIRKEVQRKTIHRF